MKEYILYGQNLIENDNTLKDFAKSICKNVTVSKEVEFTEQFKEDFMDVVEEILNYDITRTDIDYEDLLYKYRYEIIDLAYNSEKNGNSMPSIWFFGEQTEPTFINIIYLYIDTYFDDLI